MILSNYILILLLINVMRKELKIEIKPICEEMGYIKM